MIREYKTIQEISGPLMVVRKVQGVAYDELGEIELTDGSVRRCWFLGLILVFVYIMYPIKKGAVTRVNYMPWYDIVLAVLSIGTFGYQIYFLDDLIYKGSRH